MSNATHSRAQSSLTLSIILPMIQTTREGALYRIGCGAGFSGDGIDAPQAVVAAIAAGGGGAIIFETLGERTLALGHIARRQDPSKGYEPRLKDLLEPILHVCISAGITIVGN